MALRKGARMVLDSLTAEIRNLRESAYTARRATREARHVTKSNPHLSQDFADRAEADIDAILDGMERIERMIRTDIEPLLHRTDHIGEEERLAGVLARLEELEERVRRLDSNEPPLRAVR